MGADLNYRIDVNLLTSAPPVSTACFSNILLIDDGAAFAADIVKSYTSAADIDADSELDAACKAFAKQLFAQSVNPGKIKIGEGGVGADFGDDLALCYAADPDFYCVIISDRTQTEIEAIAAEIAALEKILVVQSSDAAVKAGTPANVLLTLQAADYDRVALFYHATDTEALDLSLAAYKLTADPDQQATTWANLNLSGITVDTLTSTERDTILGDGGNVYMKLNGVASTFPGKFVNGEFIDQRISGDWVSARIREDIAQLLLDVSSQNSKIPYNNEGIQQIAALVRKNLLRGESIGHFRKDSSVVTVPLVEDIADATIKARELTISATTILDGAIDQKVTINLVVSES